jgi:hypothetical protein
VSANKNNADQKIIKVNEAAVRDQVSAVVDIARGRQPEEAIIARIGERHQEADHALVEHLRKNPNDRLVFTRVDNLAPLLCFQASTTAAKLAPFFSRVLRDNNPDGGIYLGNIELAKKSLEPWEQNKKRP